MAPSDRVTYDERMKAVRDEMGNEDFAVREAEGRAMSLEQAVSCALEREPPAAM
jgi:hypothetical protein